jgi:DNA-binding IclR family transcriptional regulator
VSRICSELIAWGVVARVGQAVQLGARLGELGSRAPLEPGARTCQDSLVELASPHMVDLHTEVRRAVSLSILADTDTMCVARIAGRSDIGRAIDVGERGPAHLTAAGRALLAHGTRADVDRVLGRPLRRLTRYSMVNRDLLLRELQEVERTGIAVIREEMRLGRSSMAVPVFSVRSGTAVAAIAVSSADGRLSGNDERLLRRCGAAVTATLVERNGGAAPSPTSLRRLS